MCIHRPLLPRSSKAFTLLISLSLMLLLLVLGIAFLYRKQAQYRAAALAPYAVQARALADAGMEDCRLKFQKDPHFPPRSSDDQKQFYYRESLLDSDATTVGFFAVTIDFRAEVPPYKIARIQSVGQVENGNTVVAVHKVSAELDLSPEIRGSTNLNPNFYHLINWKDQGNL